MFDLVCNGSQTMRLLSLTSFLLALCLLPLPVQAQEPAVATALQPFVDRGTLAGAVTLVATRDRMLSLETVGYADVAAKTPIRSDALFWIASMSKPMTATALMMLVDEGKVRLDDPVEKYLPEFHGQMVVAEKTDDRLVLKKPAHPITVRNILSHTSGLPFSSLMEQPTLDLLPLRDAARSYAMTPLQFEPDTRYQYSNAGINTAGRIIEVVSGMPYEEFMDRRLFRPLGMVDTTFWPSERQLSRLARAYKPGPEQDRARGNDRDPAQISALRSDAAADAGRRPVLHGGRRHEVLPVDPQSRHVDKARVCSRKSPSPR